MPELSPLINHPIVQLIGRFHPLVIHLPIGFLIIAFIMEWVSYFDPGRKAYLKQSVPFILILGFISGVLAIITGFFLSRGGGYELEAVSSHQWAGITTTLLTLVTFIFRHKKTYLPLFTVTILSIFISGHLGGELTHGKGFITQGLEEPGVGSMGEMDVAEMALYSHVISPIFETNCQSCHNATKFKGELSLDSYETILTGGVSGEILVKGDASASEIIRRISLPENHDDAMPPEGKKRLDPNEIELLKIWINSGLPKDVLVADLDPDFGMLAVVQKMESRKLDLAKPQFADVPAVSPKKIGELVKAGFTVTPIAADYPQLQVSYFNRQDTLNQRKINLLKTVKKQVVWLDISGANILDWRFVSELKNLVRLHLKNTSVSDKDLQYLKAENLEHLNLFNTNISKKSLGKIASFMKLKSLFVGETGITTEHVTTLINDRPGLYVNTGDRKESLLKEAVLPQPSFDTNLSFIEKPTPLKLHSTIKGVVYFYSFKGEESPGNWKKLDGETITIDRTTEIHVFARKAGWQPSEVLEHAVFYRTQPFTDVILSPEPSGKYPGKGALSVNDQNLGSRSYDDGSWLGYEGKDAEVTLDLVQETEVKKVSLNILNDSNYWIFPPPKIAVFSSLDGKSYTVIGGHEQPAPQPEDKNMKQTISLEIENKKARFLKLKIANLGQCPDWHPGKGKKAWLFFNEVIVE